MYREIIMIVVPIGCGVSGMFAVDNARQSVSPATIEIEVATDNICDLPDPEPVLDTIDVSASPCVADFTTSPIEASCDSNANDPAGCERVVGLAISDVNGRIEVAVAYVNLRGDVIEKRAHGNKQEVAGQLRSLPQTVLDSVFQSINECQPRGLPL